MKLILRGYGVNMTQQQRQVARSQAQDMTIARGTDRKPQPPRDIFLQKGPRGILVNWRLPFDTSEVAGFRVYKDNESSLFAEVHDPATTQHYIDATAGSTPPVTNLFVSSFSKQGRESAKIQVQSSALTEAGAPSMPSTPNTFTRDYTLPSRGGRNQF